jgi:hypothetical protein
MKTQISLEGLHTMMKRKVLWALLTAGMAVVSTGIVNAQSLVGSWVETVKFLDGPMQGRMLTSLVTFHADFTSFSSDQGTVTLDSPPKNPHNPQTGSVSSNGVGAWSPVDGHPDTFVYTNKGLFSDLSGNLTNFLKVRGRYTVSASGDTYAGTSVFEVLGPDETPLTPPVTGTVSNNGKKIVVEKP